MVIAEWHGRAVRSADGGKSWTVSDMGAAISELTLDPRGTLWGWHGWPGIHEGWQASLVHSGDGGATWSRITLDPRRLIPQGFVSAWGTEPMVVAADGQVWQHVPGRSESQDSWTMIGTKNPDSRGHSGVATPDGLYIASRENVWLSRDHGKTWHGAGLYWGRLCATSTHVWAIDRWGNLRRSKLGENAWTTVLKVHEIEMPLRITPRSDVLYIAAEATGWTAGAFRVDPDGRVHRLKGLEGKQCHSVRIGLDGRAWFVAEGLFVEGDGDRCLKVWP